MSVLFVFVGEDISLFVVNIVFLVVVDVKLFVVL